MAEKKRTIIDAKTGKVIDAPVAATTGDQVARKITHVEGSGGDPGARRPIAIVLWIAALVCEVLAFLTIMQDSPLYGRLPGSENPWLWAIIFLVIDLVLCIVASQLWKKANHIDPPSEKNPAEFFFKSQLGAILSVIAFLPLLLLTLFDKNADGTTKKVVGIAAALALVAGIGTGADFNPVSAEGLAEMQQNAIELGNGTVYWTKSGTVYHLNPDCHHIRNSVEVLSGEAATAYENGKTRPCKDCARADGSELLKQLAHSQDSAASTEASTATAPEAAEASAEASQDEAA